MTYVDGFVGAAPKENKEKYLEHARYVATIMKEYGVLKVMECWGDDVPEGKVTSFPMAVKCQEDEVVFFSWAIWPSKQVRDEGWAKMMEDPRFQDEDMAKNMPFDGKRMIIGGFDVIMEA